MDYFNKLLFKNVLWAILGLSFLLSGCSTSSLTIDENVTTVDNLRLEYDQNNAQSSQVGITASDSGELIAFAYEDGTIKILNIRTGRPVSSFKTQFDELFELRFDRSSDKLILVFDGNFVEFYNTKTGELDHSMELADDVTRMAVSKHDDYVAFGMLGAIVHIFDLNNYSLINEIDRDTHHISGLDFDPNGSNIAVAVMASIRRNNPVEIFDIETGRSVDSTEGGLYTSLSYSQDGQRLILPKFSTNILNPATEVSSYDLNTRRMSELYSRTNLASVTVLTSAEVYDSFFIASSIDLRFNVIDLRTSELAFTTQRDGGIKLGQRFSRMGIDTKRVYPLFDGKSYLINYSDSNINQIYNAEENKITAFLYSDANEDWALIARDGKMTGTQSAINNVAWSERRSNRSIPLDATFDEYYTPELPQILFSGEYDFAQTSTLEQSIENAPSVNIISPSNLSTETSDRVTITAEITDTGGGINEVRLFHNGSNVSDATRGFRIAGGEGRTVTREFDVPLLPGENHFRLTAFNNDRIESPASEIVVTYSGAQRESELYILTIGINEYQNNRYNLNYGRSDAEAFASMFEQNGERIFSSVNVTRIYDSEATRENIQAAFEDIQQKAGPEDTFMFFYAGHGVVNEPVNPSERPDFFMALHDVTQLYGQEQLLRDRGISATELTEWVSDIEARRQMVVIDACQAGGAIDAFAFRGAAEERAIQQLARSAGVAIIASAESEQFASEFEQLGHGVFTYALLNGLEGGAILGGDTGSVTVQNLISYINQNIPELTQQYRGQTQYPVSFSRGQDFPLVVR